MHKQKNHLCPYVENTAALLHVYVGIFLCEFRIPGQARSPNADSDSDEGSEGSTDSEDDLNSPRIIRQTPETSTPTPPTSNLVKSKTEKMDIDSTETTTGSLEQTKSRRINVTTVVICMSCSWVQFHNSAVSLAPISLWKIFIECLPN